VIVIGFLAYFLLLIPGANFEADAKYCGDNFEDSCSRPDILAFEFICISGFIYLAILSVPLWYGSGAVHNTLPATPEGRLYGYLEESNEIASVFFALQVWDFLVSPFIPEFFTVIFMTHHFLAALVGWFCLEYQFLHYYAFFFLGLSEMSSIPLVVITVSETFPPTPNTFYSMLCNVAQPCFVVLFAYYRVFQWGKVSYMLWSDSYYVLSNGVAEKFRPGKSYILYITLLINILLSLMQIYWFLMIMAEVIKVVGVI